MYPATFDAMPFDPNRQAARAPRERRRPRRRCTGPRLAHRPTSRCAFFAAAVFFQSGLTKTANWASTVSLFENEYAVPLLPPELAAYLGTGVELFFPVLLVLGLGTRFAAFVLFVFNIVAVVSYPDLGAAGLKDHELWGLLLAVTLLHGPGALSLDRVIARRFFGAPAARR